jgi:hypothetical protein
LVVLAFFFVAFFAVAIFLITSFPAVREVWAAYVSCSRGCSRS